MPFALLPASAAAFAPRSAPNIVLGPRVETWLTVTLKRINRIKRPLNSVTQHQRCLTETLSSAAAIWTLASIMIPKAPNADLRRDDNLLIEAISNYQMIHIEAYVVHIDMVSQNEVAYKLTQDTIDALIEYHRDIWSVDAAADIWDWPEKEQQLKKLQQDFSHAVNRFVYRTHVRALEGLEDDGAGELLEGRSSEVKRQIMNLFLPLMPPPPKIHEAVQQQTMIAVSEPTEAFWSQLPSEASPPTFAPVDPWRVLGSTSSPTTSAGDSATSAWSASSFHTPPLASPAPAFSQPFTTADHYASTSQAYSTAGPYYSSSELAASSPLPLPSTLAAQCGIGMNGPPYGNFPWTSNLNNPILI